MTTPAKKTTGAPKAIPARAAKKAAVAKAGPAPVAKKAAAPKAAPAPVAKKAAAPKAAPAPKAKKVSAPEAKIEEISTQMQKGYNDMFTQAQEQMQKAQEQMQKMFKVDGSDSMKSFEDAVALSKSNVEAFVKASTIASKGVQDVSSLVAEITKTAIEGNVAVSKKIMECKTPQEAVELQTEAAKASYEKMIADSKRITEASKKITEEATKPLAEIYTAATEKFNVKVA